MTTLESPPITADEVFEELRKRLAPHTLLRRDEPMAKRTTLRVGGPAEIYVEPSSEEDLCAIIEFCNSHEVPRMLLGRGSNLLIRDGGIRGVVICLSHPFSSRIEWVDGKLRCGGGARLKNVAIEARRNEVTGMEFLEGIPGTVGGALRMNAGAMGSEMFAITESIRYMDPRGIVVDAPASLIHHEYRSCRFFKTHIALAATLVGQPGKRAEIEKLMNECNQKRWSSQPAAPSAGCIFKNPQTVPAGKLVQELGLKGVRVGGAVVSEVHGNFIVNDGNATARDMLQLIELVQERALRERGIELRTEVEIVGEDE
jgi:UDP-N-acetylenolpyruvoylglucosamine reductase